jgi:hypothetical protein
MPLDLIAGINKPELLSLFESRRGSLLELNLLKVAVARPGNTGAVDRLLQNIFKILLKINGQGITDLVNEHLISSDKLFQLEAVRNSAIRPDKLTLERLQHLSQDSSPWNEHGYPLLQTEAVAILASFAINEPVVKSIMTSGHFSGELEAVRAEQQPLSDDELEPALSGLNSNDPSQRAWAARVIGLSGRYDLVPLLFDAIQNKENDDEVIKSVLWALSRLIRKGTTPIELVATYLEQGPDTYSAAAILIKSGTDQALAILGHELRRIGLVAGRINDQFIAINLWRHPAMRPLVAQEMWQAVQNDPNYGSRPELFEALLEIKDANVKEYLISEAFAPLPPFHIVERRAHILKALSQLDMDSAYSACEGAIGQSEADNHSLISLILEFDEERAIESLTRIAVNCSVSLRNSIGRCLRHTRRVAERNNQLLTMFGSGDASQRFSVVELVGWLGPGVLEYEILANALDDLSRRVHSAASRAIRRQRLEKQVQSRLQALKLVEDGRKWAYLDSVLSVADPHLLLCGKDDLFLWKFLPTKRAHYVRHVIEQLEKRKRDVEKEEKDEESRN